MELTDSQLLPYPEGTDPGDAALQLQVLAKAIDAKLTAEFASFRSVVNKHVSVWRTLSDSSSIPIDTDFVVNPLGTDSVFTTATSPTSWSSEPFRGGTPGYYRIGAALASSPSGAVTANTYRRMCMSAQLSNTVTFVDVRIEQVCAESYETAGGVQYLYTELLTAVSDVVHSRIEVTFRHGNTGSNVIVRAGSVFWLYRVCDLED